VVFVAFNVAPLAPSVTNGYRQAETVPENSLAGRDLNFWRRPDMLGDGRVTYSN
jgi:hypothetical protein